MKHFIFTAALFIAFAVTAVAQPPGMSDPRRNISVEGEAEALVTPDRASLVIGVETEGMDVMTIKTENDKRVKAMFAALKSVGIADADMQTSDLQIQPQYDWKDGKRQFVKFVMRNAVHVTVRDLSKVEKAINASVSGGVNILEQVNFSSSTAKQTRDSLRIEAAKDGRNKAEALLAAVGAKLGKVSTIEEHAGDGSPVPMYKANMRMAATEDSGTSVAAGQLMIRVTLTMKFMIE